MKLLYMKERILELVNQGKTYKDIKKELGCALSTIAYYCKKMGIVSKNITNKIKNEVVEKINELYDSGMTCIEVSKELNISKTTVLKYIRNIRNIKKISESKLKINKVQQVMNWRKKAKMKLVEYKGGKCEKCGYNKCINALEFHHLNANEKDFTIAGKSWSFEKLKKESDKCILVCSNCHKEIHYEEKSTLISSMV